MAGPSKSGERITQLQKYHTQLHVRGVRARGWCIRKLGGGARGEKGWCKGGYL